MSGKTLPIPGGSILYLVDTSSIFVWNDLKSRWDQKNCGNGSGGSGGGSSSVDSDILIVRIRWNEGQEMWVPNRTFKEIQDASLAGKDIITVGEDETPTACYFEDDAFYYCVMLYKTGALVSKWYHYNQDGVYEDGSNEYCNPFDATAQPFDVVEGKVFYNADGRQVGMGVIDPSSKTVIFRDYDGSVVYSYTASEFAELTAMPANPDHSGDAIPLTAQGWNWTLEDAKSYVAKYLKLEIGQMYKTTDNKTHVLIHLEEDRTSPMLGCCPNGTVTVDWGDGTTPDTLTGTSLYSLIFTPTHNYAEPGDYDITLTSDDTMAFMGTNSVYSGLLRYTSSSSGDPRNRVYYSAVRAIRCADTVLRIGDYAFQYCENLASINLPNTLQYIGPSAFYNCYNLTSIVIPNTITFINKATFQNCYGLISIALSNSITSTIADFAFTNCLTLTSINIPNNVRSIGNNVFQSCSNLVSITIPDNVTKIGNYAFNNCANLSSIAIPDNVTSIGTNAFQGCSSLTTITIPDAITIINQYSFASCYDLTSINIPDGVTSIGPYAFNNCYALESINIPDSVISIGNSAFLSCYKLTNITIPDTILNIGASAFSSCRNLIDITIPNKVTSIGTYTFANCSSLINVTIPDTVTSIENNAFYYCEGLASIVIPSAVMSIRNSTLQNCSSLSSIIIPDGVTSIGSNAFSGCGGIAGYHILPTTPPSLANTNAFSGIIADCIMYVPKGCLEAYQTATNWSTYASHMQEEP